MRRTPPKGPLRIQCLPRSPRLRLATGLGFLVLCVLTWLILNKENPAPEQPRSAEGEIQDVHTYCLSLSGQLARQTVAAQVQGLRENLAFGMLPSMELQPACSLFCWKIRGSMQQ